MLIDLYLIHAPSVYDFRKRSIMFGPISDVIPSSSAFDMYPVGLTSIADHLESHGHRVQIVNLAQRMVSDDGYDPERTLRKLDAKLFGIDLHWLPHAHGSIEVARLAKQYHPRTPIVFGGLSSSYFHEELIRYPSVDFVLRGDSTEMPMLLLLETIKRGETDFRDIPNLTWKDGDGAVHVNELSWVPDTLDDVNVPGYWYVMRSVLRYRRLKNFLPYGGWFDYPTTTILTVRGCSENCSLCGGSRPSYRLMCNRRRPAFRSPEKMIEDARLIASFSRSPIFVIGDIRQGGREYARRFLELIKEARLPNEFVFELFRPADEEFFARIEESCAKYSLEMTLESQDEEIRRKNGKFACTNAQVEGTIGGALRHGCRKLDVFFMAGLPGQTEESAVGCADYARELLWRFGGDPRLCFFVAPLAPFLDPGSRAFEAPEEFGYRVRYRTLEEHRQALLASSWKHMLNYETDCMTRDQIADATYEAAYRLNELKREFDLISQEVYLSVRYKIEASRSVLREIDQILAINDPGVREESLAALREKVIQLNKASICGKNELEWQVGSRFAGVLSFARLGLSLVGDVFRVPHSWLPGRPSRAAQKRAASLPGATPREKATSIKV